MATQAFVVDVSSDWASASEVQRRFMRLGPATDTLSYSAHCRQARELGGDFYDFLPLSGNRLAVAIGDASGKSLPAALMISHVQSSLRTAASFIGEDPAALLAVVNRQVEALSLSDRYATLFYGVFDRATLTLTYVNAGHNPPMIIHRDGSTTWLQAGGAPVGIFPESTYSEGRVQLNPGDRLVAYTDGVTEAEGPDGAEWGLEGLRRALVEAQPSCAEAEEIVQAIFAAMDSFSQGRQSDDATVAVLCCPLELN